VVFTQVIKQYILHHCWRQQFGKGRRNADEIALLSIQLFVHKMTFKKFSSWPILLDCLLYKYVYTSDHAVNVMPLLETAIWKDRKNTHKIVSLSNMRLVC
jgi:hypothetical protein